MPPRAWHRLPHLLGQLAVDLWLMTFDHTPTSIIVTMNKMCIFSGYTGSCVAQYSATNMVGSHQGSVAS